MTTSTYTVTGMTCGHCEASVRAEVSKIRGVDAVRVSLADGTLAIDSAAAIDDADVIAAVDEAGYAAVRA